MTNKSYIYIVLSLLGILLGTCVIYWQGLNGPFLLDDYTNIVNTYISDFDRTQILYTITHNYSGTLGRPVSVLSLLLSGILHGPEPWGYKFHNLMIHLGNGLLIFWLLQKILFQISLGKDKERNLFIAGMTAAIWLLHPLMVSTVLYAVQRMAQLATMFTLASLLVFVSIRDNEFRSRLEFYTLAYLLFPLFLVLAIFSKENGALVPVYIFVIELIVFQFTFSSRMARNRLLVFETVFVALPVLVGALYTLTHLDKLANYATRNFDMGERLLTELHVTVLYLKMILLPRLSDMTLFHDYFEITRSVDLMTVILMLLFFLATFLIYYLRKKAPVISLGIAWFIVSHLLESTIFSLELMFEHRNYLAAVGPILVLVYYLCKIPALPNFKYFNIVILCLFAFMTTMRVQEWKSKEQIVSIAVAEHPDSARAQVEMAALNFQAGNYRETLLHMDIAQELLPSDFGPAIHQATFRCSSGNDLAPWIEIAAEKAGNNPVTVYGMNSLDTLISFIANDACPEVSAVMLLSVVKAAKNFPGNQLNTKYFSYLEIIEGNLYLLLGEYQEAMGLKLSAFEKTGDVQILANMTKTLLTFRRLEEAEQIINYMETLNEESRGVESALLEPLLKELAVARNEGNNIE